MAKISVTTRGYIEVWLGDVFISRHRVETEAIESCLAYAETLPAGEYTFELRYPNKTVKAYGILSPGGDTQAPTIPTGLAQTGVSATTASFSWSESTDNVGVAGYHIYRNGVPSIYSTTSALTFTDTGLTPDTPYTYQVAAYDAAGNNSGFSGQTALVITTDPNAAPVWSVSAQQLTTNVGYGLTLTTVCTDADGDALTFTQIAGTLPAGVSYNAASKALTGTPTTPSTGTVTFRASDGITTTDQAISWEVRNADATAPSVPTGLTATAVSSSQINVSWTASTDTAGAGEWASGMASYLLYRSTDGTNYSLRTTVSSPTTSYSDTGLAANTPYYYKIAARDLSNNTSAQSSAANATTQQQQGGELLLFDNFDYAVGQNEAGDVYSGNPGTAWPKFQTGGWTNCKRLPSSSGARGYIYTVTQAEMQTSAGSTGPLPGGGARCLKMSSPINNADQTDFYLGYEGGTNYLPANVWIQFWIFSPHYGSETAQIGYREKFIYPSNDGYGSHTNKWLIAWNAWSQYPFDAYPYGTSTNGEMALVAYDPMVGNCNYAPAGDPAEGTKLGPNIGPVADCYVRANTWTLVKIHLDTSNNASGTFEYWLRPYGGSWRKCAEWIGGVTSGFTWSGFGAGGHSQVRIPTTIPASANPNTRGSQYYLDDWCFATSEAALPTY